MNHQPNFTMSESKHVVAVFGGAVSGAEATNQLTQRGIRVIVFEQNELPYGKIEDGLPKWHAKLRDKEEGRINVKMSHPLVTYVPMAELGKNIDFEEVAKEWGFSAVLLATGAWKDRPLPVDGADNFLNKGLYYQNAFIYWFNHFHEPNFAGQQYDTPEETIIVGGGLASIDVAKALMMLNVEKALAARGIKTNILELDRGIPKFLEKLDLTIEDLGVKPCTLYYRRRIIDMPLSPVPVTSPEQLIKVQNVREKVATNAMNKFCFTIAPNHVPVKTIEENGSLVGLVFQETEIIDGRAKAIEGSDKEVRGPLVISSIGSIPDPIEGIPMKWQTYDVNQDDCCRIEGYDHVFALGNAVTGRGNIKESMRHGKEVTTSIFEKYLAEKEAGIALQVNSIAEQIKKAEPPSEDVVNAINAKVETMQKEAGYKGDYMNWVAEKLPVRLEDLVGGH